MAVCIKRDHQPEIVKTIQRIEDRADKCFKNLALFELPWSTAAWAALTDAIRIIEVSIPDDQYGSRNHSNAATSMSMTAALIYRFVRQLCLPDIVRPAKFEWKPRIASQARLAFEQARGYSTFCLVFPYWHAHKYAGELVDDSTVKFVSNASIIGRRINAYQQGIRPKNFGVVGLGTIKPTVELQSLNNRAMKTALRVSENGVSFSDVGELRVHLYMEQQKRILSTRRRYPDIRIGGYSLDDFGKFYSAVNAVASAHEFLCYLWGRENHLPIDSLLLFEHRSEWVKILSELAGLAREQIYEMLRDTTFGRVRAADFHLLPFVPLNAEGTVLALAPFCSLSANWEENVLRCFSRRDSDAYSGQSLTKEDEMRAPLVALTSGTRLITGPYNLQKGIPDIDLLIQDLEARVLVVCELKWIRKPNGQREREDRDQEVLKGFYQISKIRDFIENNPKYLSDRGVLARNISDFEHVHYCVIARDHFVEPPTGSLPLYSYDAFIVELTNNRNTLKSLQSLQALTWLPIEGSDFTVRFEISRVGGVAVISEVYYPDGGPMAFVL
jgi:hypothetical protein